MKTKATIFALSVAAACAASTALAQQAGLVESWNASQSPGAEEFEEVAIDSSFTNWTGQGAVASESAAVGMGASAAYCSSSACGGCVTSCGSACGCGTCCCESPFRHRSGVFGEFLYLRPRDTEVAFAVLGQTPVVPAGEPVGVVPQGPTLILDPDYQPGYRVGATLAFDDRMSVQLSYATLETQTQNGGTATADDLLANRSMFPLLIHPLTFTPNNVTNVSAQGEFDVDFDIIDLDTRLLLWNNKRIAINAITGVRWANMDQNLLAAYTINGGTIVEGGSQYDGLGARMGLDGQYRSRSGFGLFGKSVLSLMYGAARGEYRQYLLNDPANPQVFTEGKYDRLAPIFDFETGVDWVSDGGTLRLAAGYLTSVWFNVITANDYIDGIQNRQFDDFSDTITFDGFTARAEVRF